MYEEYLDYFEFDSDSDNTKLPNCIIRIIKEPFKDVRLRIGTHINIKPKSVIFDYYVLEPHEFIETQEFREFVNGIFMALFERGLKKDLLIDRQ